ncbi:MAG: hypothetical protein U5K54_24340 [Cytophagales bacterium]|nr:hypothetical protein [Cytophagales bacterium]
MAGKEWKKTTKTFGIHARLLYSGGLRQAPIDEFASSLLGTTVYDLTQGYRIQLPNYFRSDLRVSWRKRQTRIYPYPIPRYTKPN